MAGNLTSITNEIGLTVQTPWLAGAEAIAGEPTKLLYALRDGDAPPKGHNGTWARVTVRHSTVPRSSIGRRRIDHSGTVYVNIFVPLAKTNAGAVSLLLADLVADAFKDHKGNVDFRSVRPIEAGQDGGWTQINVLADFVWTELRS